MSTSTLSSPRREVMTSPVTATWSPRSTSDFQSASRSSPTLSSESIAWISAPPPERRVAKQSLPVLRTKMTRPAIETTSPVAVSGSRSGYAARTCAMVRVTGTVTG